MKRITAWPAYARAKGISHLHNELVTAKQCRTDDGLQKHCYETILNVIEPDEKMKSKLITRGRTKGPGPVEEEAVKVAEAA